MPRPRKPFKFRDYWVSKIDGQRMKLCPLSGGFKEAQKQLNKLLAEYDARPTDVPISRFSVANVVDLFLDHVKAEKSDGTFDDYYYSLQPLVAEYGRCLASEMTLLDAERVKQKLKGSTRHFCLATKTCWNWALDRDLLVKNPFRKLHVPKSKKRERIVTDDEFRNLMRHAGAHFRQVLYTLRNTPSRPGDLRKLSWCGRNCVDFSRHCWIIYDHKTIKTMKKPKPRLVAMIPSVEKLLLYRQRKRPHPEVVFTNAGGTPWTKNALVRAMSRVVKRAQIRRDENGESITLYNLRHTLFTNAARNGATGPELQVLGGWTSLEMVNTYTHLDNVDAHRIAVRTLQKRNVG